MKPRLLWLGIIFLLLFTGCAKDRTPVAGLAPMPPEAAQTWGVPDSLVLRGEGNSFRLLQGTSLGAPAGLELAAGAKGQLEYFREISTRTPSQFSYRLQFLSTQGDGQVRLSALDSANQVIATLGWVSTGRLPEGDNRSKWFDGRYSSNFQGGWLAAGGEPSELFAKHLPGISLAQATKYRLSVEVGQGQHTLITGCQLVSLPARAVRITPQAESFAAKLGDLIDLPADIENTGQETLHSLAIALVEPYGYGLVTVNDRVKTVDSLAPGEKRRLVWQVKAQRPHAVNLGKPWIAGFAVNGVAITPRVAVTVSDPRPGKIFYVMTEDLEPMDSAGYPTQWGNADGWLQPEELEVQMVAKAERLNSIAEAHGAKWTHYIAWPVVKAAEWAAGQSASGEWPKVVAAIKRSVREQSSRGHEYAVHLHSDYDPYLPGNVLSYNPAVDGLWANHLRHGWAHSVGAEGSFGDYASRTGMLYAYQRIIDELESGSPHGQLLTSRAGSFDFGNGTAEEEISTKAYRKVGLWASSDADGNQDGITAGPFGQEIYLAKPNDINVAADDLASTGLVEFRPTPKDFIEYNDQTAGEMNRKVDQGIAFFAPDGLVKPGIHAVVGFTHAMFMLGNGDWKSVEGGQFQALDDHLGYLQLQYAAKGLLLFGTANDLVKAYLDYYTPAPVAVYGPRSSDNWGIAQYPVIILGRDIPIDASHPHTVALKYPLYLRDSTYRISILKDGNPVFSTWGLPTPFNDINFTIDDANAHYSLKVYHNEYIVKFMAVVRAIKARISPASL